MDFKIKIFISLAVAFLSFLGIYSYIKMREKELLLRSEMRPVFVAKKDIPIYSQIDETLITETEVPQEYIQPGAITNFENAAGQIASAPIMAGEQLLGTKILKFGSETGASMKIPSGMRAISIAVNDITGVAQLVQPDDFVDLICTFDFGDMTQSRKYTYTLFENVQVLAVQKDLGDTFSALSKKSQEKGFLDQLKSDQKSSNVVTYTVVVTPEDAQQLVLAQETGRLTVSLRSLWDSENTLNLKPTTPADLTGLKSLIKQSESPSYMEYRGGKR